jgi:hypothetical protein
VAPKDWRLIAAYDSCGIPPSQALPIGTLLLEEEDDGALIVRSRDGRLRFDLIELLGDVLSFQLLHNFDPMPLSEHHTPRIQFDQLVVCRETWRFKTDGIPFAYVKDEADRFVSARRWMHAHQLPRLIFIKTAVEPKPFFIDLASHVSVNLFAKAVRRLANSNLAEEPITVSEMLPAPDQTWLTDREGRRYTCEFRIVGVDMRRTKPSNAETRDGSDKI